MDFQTASEAISITEVWWIDFEMINCQRSIIQERKSYFESDIGAIRSA